MAKSDHKAREQRILDAAAELFAHYGYDKTAVSDIAREAGVSQGGIYLHFDSKEALFEALLIREMRTYAESWLQRLDADPKGGTIAGMYRTMLYALNASPFMTAMFRQDRRVFGSYLRKPGNFFQHFQGGGRPSPRFEFVQLMQEAGAIRQDLNPKVVTHIMNMLAYGLVAMDEVVPAEEIPPMEDLIEGIADFMDRALTPDDGGNQEAGKAIIRQISDAARQQFEHMSHPVREE
ncbi:MAG: TetR/AcrR family transcriptional regulator [Anaerolineae bacterium]|nr:TetR/AcrR family transcriptional regulator [Anaerolineae bacterium]